MVDHGIDVLIIDDDSPGLGSASIVIGIDDNNGIVATSNEPPGLGSIPDESIVIETWSESPGLGPIPNESIGIETWSKPPGLGLIPSEPLLHSSIDDGVGTAPGEQHKKIRGFETPRGCEHEIDETLPSKPHGLGSRLSASIHDCVETTPFGSSAKRLEVSRCTGMVLRKRQFSSETDIRVLL